ncbi:hypothetical protein Q1695_000695 [Nippostrongylus brasiliensis]|nr:hypothetical protein Q1695_000695 [Nippostrongylus brasiliensis]
MPPFSLKSFPPTPSSDRKWLLHAPIFLNSSALFCYRPLVCSSRRAVRIIWRFASCLRYSAIFLALSTLVM